MKKIFKKFFSKDRINLISENLSSKDLYVLEIGVHKGDFSKQLANNLDPKKLILVDPWIAYDDEVYSNSWYGNSSISNQVIQDQYFLDIKKYFQNEIRLETVEVHRKTSDDFFDQKLDQKSRSCRLWGRFGTVLGRLGRSKASGEQSWTVLEASWRSFGWS